MAVIFMIMNTYQLLSLKNITKPTIAEIFPLKPNFSSWIKKSPRKQYFHQVFLLQLKWRGASESSRTAERRCLPRCEGWRLCTAAHAQSVAGDMSATHLCNEQVSWKHNWFLKNLSEGVKHLWAACGAQLQSCWLEYRNRKSVLAQKTMVLKVL